MDRYTFFETAAGFCGIAWNDAGITRFQLPAKTGEAAERLVRRRLSGAEPGEPPHVVREAIAAATRYFDGEETDFSSFALDLDGQLPFFKQIYAAARRVGWGHTTTYGTLAKELGAPGLGPPAMSVRPWRRTPSRSSSPATGFWRRAARWRLLRAGWAGGKNPRARWRSGCCAGRRAP